MTDKLTLSGRRSALPLIGVLAVLAISSVTIPSLAAAAAPAGQADADFRPSEWAAASDLESSRKAPSLTNQVGTPEGGSGSELWLGYGLLGASLLVLACGLGAGVAERARVAGSPRSPAGNSSGPHPAAIRVRR